MNNKLPVLIVIPFLLLAQASVKAASVSLASTSTIISVSGSALAGISAGDPISVQFSYDNATPANFISDFVRYSNSDPFSISFASGSTTFSWESGDNDITVSDDVFAGTSQWFDSLGMSGTNATNTDTLGGLTPLRVSLGFTGNQDCFEFFCPPDNLVPMLSDSSIPDQPFNYDSGRLNFYFTSTTGRPDATIFFGASTVRPVVPLPASFILMLSGFGAFMGFTWRNKNIVRTSRVTG